MKIVIGYDGSPRAIDALALGETVAETVGARLVLACVYQPSEAISARIGPDPATERRVAQAQATLAAAPLAERALAERRAIAGSTPAESLRRVAEREHAALLVLGSTTRSGVGQVSPGSVAERLTHGAPCALAVAPLGYAAAPHSVRTVAVAFDGREESVHALQTAKGLARRAGAGLRIVRANELDGDPASTLLAATREDVDLLVAGSRGYGPLRRVLLGSVSGELMRHASCPVCVVPRGVTLELADAPRPERVAGR